MNHDYVIYDPPIHSGLKILFQDECFLILDKPCGLLSVPGRGPDKKDSLSLRVQAEFPDACIVHRLDMETSGIMVMAHGKDNQRAMSALFENRKVNKSYIALVGGHVNNIEGIIDLAIMPDWPNRPRQIVDPIHGKQSLTNYHVLEYNSETDVTRIKLAPVTGRSHQLRVHMQAIGHAILGDRLYANKKQRGQAARLMLHANHIHFEHPITKKLLSIESNIPF